MQLELASNRDASLAFLRLVLPATGVYYLMTKRRTGAVPPRIPFPSIPDLLDGLLSYTHQDVYFSCASFKDNTGSTGTNIKALQALRADVDFGEGKPWKTEQEAIAAIQTACHGAGIPPAALVRTGHGLHAWWPLSEPLNRDVWQRYADALLVALRKHGLTLLSSDAVCVTDPARVLRCPGTLNFKSGTPCPVELDSRFFLMGLPYKIEQFASLLESSNVVAVQFKPKAPQQAAGRTVYSEQARTIIKSMFDAYPAGVWDNRAFWFKAGAALYETGWGPPGYDLWTKLSRISHKFDERKQIETWESFGRSYDSAKVTLGTFIAGAKKLGWKPPAIMPSKPVAPRPAAIISLEPQELDPEEPSQFTVEQLKQIDSWVVDGRNHIKERAYQNTRIALAKLDVQGKFNLFTNRRYLKIPWLSKDWVLFTDNITISVRTMIINKHGFDPGKLNVNDGLEEFSDSNKYDPVLEYLDGVKWDGVNRLDSWLTDYLGVEQSPVTQIFGSLFLMGAVRRAKHPGCKFDHMLILEGEEGIGKSSAAEILGLREYYANGPLDTKSTQKLMETLEGTWWYEWGELEGIGKADNDRLKSILSSGTDGARQAYGRQKEIRPRRNVFVGTTNEVNGQYFSERAGHRRYWPVICHKIDLKALTRDRDLLYAEAVHKERNHGLLLIPKSHYEAVKAIQSARTMPPEWEELVAALSGEQHFKKGLTQREFVERVSMIEVFSRLGLTTVQVNRQARMNIRRAMFSNGWRETEFYVGKEKRRGFERDVDGLS